MLPCIVNLLERFRQDCTAHRKPEAILDACRQAGYTWRERRVAGAECSTPQQAPPEISIAAKDADRAGASRPAPPAAASFRRQRNAPPPPRRVRTLCLSLDTFSLKTLPSKLISPLQNWKVQLRLTRVGKLQRN
jgi:hypothetical protein